MPAKKKAATPAVRRGAAPPPVKKLPGSIRDGSAAPPPVKPPTGDVRNPTPREIIPRLLVAGVVAKNVGSMEVPRFVSVLGIAYYAADGVTVSAMAQIAFQMSTMVDTRNRAPITRATYVGGTVSSLTGPAAATAWDAFITQPNVFFEDRLVAEGLLRLVQDVLFGTAESIVVGATCTLMDTMNGGMGDPGPHAIAAARFAALDSTGSEQPLSTPLVSLALG
ncbi:MAG: hypothetical protein MUF21_00280 [Gemmatimonadaceae bacterium]|jgi:hypothetical protein|nr:hypothetical protein [Gemmatimonadaceae bacterium]